ncbi:MAG: hypothetical protein ACHQT8_03050 [Chlamydiales bacterium]
MSVKTAQLHAIRTIVIEAPKIVESKPVTTQAAEKVLACSPLNNLLFSFMPFNDRDRMKGVSKTCEQSAKHLERLDLLRLFPKSAYALVGGEEGVKRIKIRNFPIHVESPLSNYPDFMAGWEQSKKGVFAFYLIHTGVRTTSASSCLPKHTTERRKELSYFNSDGVRVIRRIEWQTSCCASMSREPGCLAGIAFMCSPCRFEVTIINER